MSEEAVQAAETIEEKEPEAERETIEMTAETAEEPKASVTEDAPAVVAETPQTTVAAPINAEDVSYQAVEKEGTVTAIWEMQGQKHLRTIDPRSIEGKQILALFETAG